ncbi:MAG: hypothetical protein K5639_01770 [Eubacterium sp.]|nr:hypothetical protein [Eubacterium sp.]
MFEEELEGRSGSDYDDSHTLEVEDRRRAELRKIRKYVIIGIAGGLALISLVTAIILWRINAPSSDQESIASQLNISGDEVAIVVDTELKEEKGIVVDEKVYIPAEAASSYFDDRIYVDKSDGILTYVTEKKITDIKVKEKVDGKKPLIKKKGELYVMLDYIMSNGACDCIQFNDPTRVVVFHDRNRKYGIISLKENVRVRKGPGKKYPYYTEVKADETVYANAAKQPEKEYTPIVTKDGVAGYIPNESIKSTENNVREFESQPTSFKRKAMSGKLCLGWHNVNNGSSTLPSNIKEAKAVNVICPSWIAVKTNGGDIECLANADYVSKVHAQGKKVWSTVSDFKYKNFKHAEVFGKLKPRRKLISNIIHEAKKYKLDGLNIDFEDVGTKTSKAYLEFLRELIISTHKEKLIVSSDVKAITEYNNTVYNFAEQGRVADYVIVMAYDEHTTVKQKDKEVEPGSVSSIGYVKKCCEDILGYVDAERVAIGLPFYTRLWKETKKKVSADIMGMSTADDWIFKNGLTPEWNDEAGQYYAEKKQGKTKYSIWMENNKSIETKLKAVDAAGIDNLAFWAMEQELGFVWHTIGESIK